jgi:acyl-CoA synthetase (AMP-forming)/AMP-acid ligase II
VVVHGTVPLLLAAKLETAADEVALIDDDGRYTWRELTERVHAWMVMFDAHGVGVGDRVSCLMHNSGAAFEVLLAGLHCGAVVVPVNWHLTPAEVGYIVRNSGSRLLVCDDVDEQTAEQAAAGSRCAVVLAGQVAGPATAEPRAQVCGSTMMYTSGTTGNPKGVVNNLFRTGAPFDKVERMKRYAQSILGVPRDGVKLLCGPWYHSSQLFFALLSLLSGSRLVIQRRFDPQHALNLMTEHQVSHAHLVPTHFVRLLRLDDSIRSAFDPSGLRLVWHGGGPCAELVKRRMIDWWGPVLTEYYGATEGGALTLIDSADWLTHPGSVGRALPANEILIVGADGRPVAPGVEGTVCVRRAGGTRFRYHNAEDKTRDAHLDEATFTVGDIGHLDADGYLYLRGRSAEVIVSGAVNVYPAEVETVLRQNPEVIDVAVFGVPDPEFGDVVAALVECAGLDGRLDDLAGLADRLDDHARRSLAGYKVPRRYFIVDRVPREASGKVRRDLFDEAVAGARQLCSPAREAAS